MLAHFRTDTKQALSLDAESLEWLDSRFAAVQKQPGDTFQEKLSALRDCVDLLPDNYRQPVQMRYQKELPLGEIVQSLSIAMETLKKRLTRPNRNWPNAWKESLSWESSRHERKIANTNRH